MLIFYRIVFRTISAVRFPGHNKTEALGSAGNSQRLLQRSSNLHQTDVTLSPTDSTHSQGRHGFGFFGFQGLLPDPGNSGKCSQPRAGRSKKRLGAEETGRGPPAGQLESLVSGCFIGAFLVRSFIN